MLAKLTVIPIAFFSSVVVMMAIQLRRKRLEIEAAHQIIDHLVHEHWVFLCESNAALSSSLDYETTIRQVARLAVPSFANWCEVALIENDGQLKSVAYPSALPVRSPIEEALRTGKAKVLHEVAPQLSSVIAAPLIARGRQLGAICFGLSSASRRYSERDLDMVEQIATRAALAVDNALLYRSARKAIRDRDDLIAMVSHDLKNPLSSIQLQSGSLLSRLSSGQPAAVLERGLTSITVAARTMSQLVDDLLSFERIQDGHVELRPEPVRAGTWLKSAVSELQAQADAKGVSLDCDEVQADPLVQFDPKQLARVVSNLVGNAIKFSPSGSVVRVSLSDSAGEVTVLVEDRGAGIAPTDLERVFEPYWQSAEGRGRGTGLGLAISKRLVEAHHGRIWVESRLGHGSTFGFTLRK